MEGLGERQGECAKGATHEAQRTYFEVRVKSLLGFLKGYGHSRGCRTEMQSPGLRWGRGLGHVDGRVMT